LCKSNQETPGPYATALPVDTGNRFARKLRRTNLIADLTEIRIPGRTAPVKQIILSTISTHKVGVTLGTPTYNKIRIFPTTFPHIPTSARYVNAAPQLCFDEEVDVYEQNSY
jgi:hypothetical protein